jgi:hypothetical protein
MLALATLSAAFAGAPLDCDQVAGRISSVADTDGYQTPYDLEHDGYDPNPLLVKRIFVGGDARTCVTAQLSIHTFQPYPLGDEYAAAKVTIDGLPMYGHITGCKIKDQFVPCITLQNQTDGMTPVSSHSYHLVMPNVTPGWHTVEVFYAGLDNQDVPDSDVGAYVGGAVLSVHHP